MKLNNYETLFKTFKVVYKKIISILIMYFNINDKVNCKIIVQKLNTF